MKTNSKKIQPVLMLLCVVLFTTATGSFTSMACKPSCDKTETKKETVVEPASKKMGLPIMNPLQILSAKFL